MPRYDYTCSQGHTTEAQRGREVSAIPCPVCGNEAQREAVYADQFIRGETVAKGARKSSPAGDIKNRHGQYRVKLWQESQAEAHHKRQRGAG